MTRAFSSLRTTAGRFAVNFALLALLALVMLVSMRFGSLKLTFAEIVGTLWNRPDGINGQIIFNIRLPRILLGALVGGAVYALIMVKGFDFTVNYAVLAVICAAGSVAGQFGDLIFSYIKREFGIKDYGRLFPGHGGVLDRFDSIFLTTPVTAVLLALLPAILQ